MAENANRRWLYNELTRRGSQLGKFEDFDNAMNNDQQTRDWAYNTAVSYGINMGSASQYANAMGFGDTAAQRQEEARKQAEEAKRKQQEQEEFVARQQAAFMQQANQKNALPGMFNPNSQDPNIRAMHERLRQQDVENAKKTGQMPAYALPMKAKTAPQQTQKQPAQKLQPIQPQKNGPDGYGKDLGESLMSGLGHVAQIPYLFIGAFEDWGSGIANKATFGLIPKTHAMRDFMDEYLGGKYFREGTEYYDKESDRYNDGKGVFDSVLEGDWGKAFGKLGLGVAKNAPNLVASIVLTMTGNPELAATTLSGAAACEKWEEVSDDNTMSDQDKAVAVLGTYLSEYLFERLGDMRIQKMLGGGDVAAVKKELAKDANGALQKFLNSKAARGFGKAYDWLMKYFGESATEMCTELSEQSLDMYLGKRDNLDWNAVMDAGAIAMASDGPLQLIGYGKDSYGRQKIEREVNGNVILNSIASLNGLTAEQVADISMRASHGEELSQEEYDAYNGYLSDIRAVNTRNGNIAKMLGEAGVPKDGNGNYQHGTIIFGEAVRQLGLKPAYVGEVLAHEYESSKDSNGKPVWSIGLSGDDEKMVVSIVRRMKAVQKSIDNGTVTMEQLAQRNGVSLDIANQSVATDGTAQSPEAKSQEAAVQEQKEPGLNQQEAGAQPIAEQPAQEQAPSPAKEQTEQNKTDKKPKEKTKSTSTKEEFARPKHVRQEMTTIKLDGKPVKVRYSVGNAVWNEDGSINTEKSSQILIFPNDPKSPFGALFGPRTEDAIQALQTQLRAEEAQRKIGAQNKTTQSNPDNTQAENTVQQEMPESPAQQTTPVVNTQQETQEPVTQPIGTQETAAPSIETQEAPAAEVAAQPVDITSSLPTKKDGSLDFDSMTPEQKFNYQVSKKGTDSAVTLAQKTIDKLQQQKEQLASKDMDEFARDEAMDNIDNQIATWQALIGDNAPVNPAADSAPVTETNNEQPVAEQPIAEQATGEEPKPETPAQEEPGELDLLNEDVVLMYGGNSQYVPCTRDGEGGYTRLDNGRKLRMTYKGKDTTWREVDKRVVNYNGSEFILLSTLKPNELKHYSNKGGMIKILPTNSTEAIDVPISELTWPDGSKVYLTSEERRGQAFNNLLKNATTIDEALDYPLFEGKTKDGEPVVLTLRSLIESGYRNVKYNEKGEGEFVERTFFGENLLDNAIDDVVKRLDNKSEAADIRRNLGRKLQEAARIWNAVVEREQLEERLENAGGDFVEKARAAVKDKDGKINLKIQEKYKSFDVLNNKRENPVARMIKIKDAVDALLSREEKVGRTEVTDKTTGKRKATEADYKRREELYDALDMSKNPDLTYDDVQEITKEIEEMKNTIDWSKPEDKKEETNTETEKSVERKEPQKPAKRKATDKDIQKYSDLKMELEEAQENEEWDEVEALNQEMSALTDEVEFQLENKSAENSSENLRNSKKSSTFVPENREGGQLVAVNITQNAGEDGAENRRGKQNEADRLAFKNALLTLRKSNIPEREKNRAKQTITEIQARRREQMSALVSEALKDIPGVSNVSVDAGIGVYINTETRKEVIEYTCSVEANVEEKYNEAFRAAMALIAQVSSQDSFILNYPDESFEEGHVPAERWHEPAMSMSIELNDPLSVEEQARLTGIFAEVGLGLTITNSEISSSFHGEQAFGQEINPETYRELCETLIYSFLNGTTETTLRELRRGGKDSAKSFLEAIRRRKAEDGGAIRDLSLNPDTRFRYSTFYVGDKNGNERTNYEWQRWDEKWESIIDREPAFTASEGRIPATNLKPEDLLNRLQKVWNRTGGAMSAAAISRDAAARTVSYLQDHGVSVNVITLSEAESAILSKEEVEELRTSGGDLYGFSKNGDVYVIAERFNPNTPVHEFTHLWVRQFAKDNPKEWKEFISVLKKDRVWQEVVADSKYAKIKDDERKVASEVMARLMGEYWSQMDSFNRTRMDDTFEEKSFKARVRALIRKFSKWIAGKFGKDLNFKGRDFEPQMQMLMNAPMRDLISWQEARKRLGNTSSAEFEKKGNSLTERNKGDYSTRYKLAAELINRGWLLHGTPAEFEKFDEAKISGGARAHEGYGFYFSDAPYKSLDYGGNLKLVKKDNFNFINSKTKIKDGDLFLGEYEELQSRLAIAKEEQMNVRNNHEYDTLQHEIDEIQAELENYDDYLIDFVRLAIRELGENCTLGAIEKTIPIQYIPRLTAQLVHSGYDGYETDGIYTIFNFEKLNNNVQTLEDVEKAGNNVANETNFDKKFKKMQEGLDKGGQNVLSLQQISELTDALQDDIRQGNRPLVFERVPLEALQSSIRKQRTLAEALTIAALRSRRESRALRRDAREVSSEERVSRDASENQMLLDLIQYAKDKGIWMENVVDALDERYGEDNHYEGRESDVWVDAERGVVVKAKIDNQYETMEELLEGMILNNWLFNGNTQTIIGFGIDRSGGDKEGIRVVYETPYVDMENTTPITDEEKDEYMSDYGFILKEGEDGLHRETREHANYTNGNFEVKDLKSDNIVRDSDGNIRVVDPTIQWPEGEHYKEQTLEQEELDAENEETLDEMFDDYTEFQIEDNGVISSDDVVDMSKDAVKQIQKTSDDYSVARYNSKTPMPDEIDKLDKFVNSALDRGNGLRILRERMNAARKKLSRGAYSRDKYDIRALMEQSEGAISARQKLFEDRELNNLLSFIFGNKNGDVVGLAKAIENSELYKKHKTELYKDESGDVRERELSVTDFIGRYLIARDTVERIELGIPPRGVRAFKQLMGVDMVTFAKQFIDEFGVDNVTELHKRVKAVTDLSIKSLYESGVITAEAYETYKSRKFYVPEKGFESQESEIAKTRFEQFKKGFFISIGMGTPGESVKTRGKQSVKPMATSYRARGGNSLAGDVFAHIVQDTYDSIMKSEHNKVKLAMYNMLREDVEVTQMLRIPVPKEVYYVKNEDGKWERMSDGPTKEEKAEARAMTAQIRILETALAKSNDDAERDQIYNAIDSLIELMPFADEYTTKNEWQNEVEKSQEKVGVWVDGVLQEMRFPNMVEVANALNDRVNTELSIRAAREIGNVMASVCTQYNPTFFAVNIVRDTPFIVKKGIAEYGWEFATKFAEEALSPENHRAIWDYINGKFDENANGVNRDFYDFVTGGGQTGYSRMKSLEEIRIKIRSLENMSAGAQAFLDIAPKLNEWSELFTRFGAYRAVIEMGMSKEEALKAAKNLSVNFNRRGFGGPVSNVLGSLSMFANATVQGASGFYRAFGGEVVREGDTKARKAARMFSLAVAMPAICGLLLTLANMDDDDDEYQIPEWERDNYICLGDVRIPLNEQIKPFWLIGVNTAMLINGKRTAGEALTSLIGSIATNLIPAPPALNGTITLISDKVGGKRDVSWEHVLRNMWMPQGLQNWNALAEGKDWLGNDLRKDFGDIPEFRTNENEASLYRDLAWIGYRMFGGRSDVYSTHREDGSEILYNRNAKEIKNNIVFGLAPSGWVNAIETIWGLGHAVFSDDSLGESLDWKNAPIINRFYKPTNPEMFRYGIVKQAKEEIQTYNDMKSNYKKQAEGGNEAAKTELEALEAKAEKNGIKALQSTMREYDKISLFRQAMRVGLSVKEFKRQNPNLDYEHIDEEEKRLTQIMLHQLNSINGIQQTVDATLHPDATPKHAAGPAWHKIPESRMLPKRKKLK